MNVLITLLIVIVIIGLIYWLIGLLPIAQPFKNIAIAILVLIAIVYLVGLLFGATGFQPVRWR